MGPMLPRASVRLRLWPIRSAGELATFSSRACSPRYEADASWNSSWNPVWVNIQCRGGRPRLLDGTSRVFSPISTSMRAFSTTSSRAAKNRIYTTVRRPEELQNYILLSTSARTPLITLWTASYCPSCRTIAPLVSSLIESGVGESSSSSVSYCEVEFDSQDIIDSELGMQYMITSLPTLVSFDRGEEMMDTRTVDVTKMKSEAWLKEWIEREARRKGEGTSGGVGIEGSIGGGLFGGLFGLTKR